MPLPPRARTRASRIVLTTCCLVLLALVQKPAAQPVQPAFTAQVQALLAAPWAHMYITAAGFSDDGSIYGTFIELKRDKPGSEISFKELSAKSAAFQPLSAEKYRSLTTAVLASAAEVEQQDTPGEIISSISPAAAAKLLKERKLPSNWDVELFVLRSITATGSTFIENGGHAKTWTDHLAQEYSITTKTCSLDEIKPALGRVPWEEAR